MKNKVKGKSFTPSKPSSVWVLFYWYTHTHTHVHTALALLERFVPVCRSRSLSTSYSTRLRSILPLKSFRNIVSAAFASCFQRSRSCRLETNRLLRKSLSPPLSLLLKLQTSPCPQISYLQRTFRTDERILMGLHFLQRSEPWIASGFPVILCVPALEMTSKARTNILSPAGSWDQIWICRQSNPLLPLVAATLNEEEMNEEHGKG